MARTRDIRTNQADISCDVCGRTLLRGERAEPYLAGGERRQVCELCTVRAQHEGWIREDGGDEPTLRSSRQEGRGRGFLEKVRARPARAPAAGGGARAGLPGEVARPPRARPRGGGGGSGRRGRRGGGPASLRTAQRAPA